MTWILKIRSVWLNCWVFIYELSGCGFKSRCSHSTWILIFQQRFLFTSSLLTSLSSEKIPTIWEILIYFNLRIPEQKFGIDSTTYRAGQLWKNVLEEIRNSTSLPVFKEKIKKIQLISCSCNCCRKYIHHVGFIYLIYLIEYILVPHAQENLE